SSIAEPMVAESVRVSDKERPPPTERAGAQHGEVRQSRACKLQLSPSCPLVPNSCGAVSDTKFCAERQAIAQTYLQNYQHFSLSSTHAPLSGRPQHGVITGRKSTQAAKVISLPRANAHDYSWETLRHPWSVVSRSMPNLYRDS
ncbi:MAG TPA: hypothetical protein VF634_05490, partial [Pyrinomonadaceae bacterium]